MERLCALFLIFMAGITAVGGINIYDFCAVTHIELTTALILRMPESNAHFCDESEPWRFTPSAGRQYMISIISYSVGCEYGRMNLYDFQHDLLIGIPLCTFTYFPIILREPIREFRLTFNRTSVPWKAGNGFSILVTAFRETPQYTPCYYGEFKCGNNHCILDTLMCDGYDNCGDNSDESSRSCSWKYTTTSIRTNAMPTTRTSRPSGGSVCDIGEFECDNGLCISYAYKCDGDNDCGDNSDEVHGCYGHNAGVITGGLLASVFFIVFVIALVLARYRWYMRNINSNRGAVIVNTVSAGLDMTTERTYVGSSTPLVPAVPPSYVSTPPPYPPSQYDPGYGY